jgi:hypothetical protein
MATFSVACSSNNYPPKPEQEPVAWEVFEGNLHDMFFTQEEALDLADMKGTYADVRPLYTTPPAQEFVCSTGMCHYKAQPAAQRQPLTEDEVLRLWAGDVSRPVLGKNKVLAFAREIAAAYGIKEKNT